jgi:NAD(P)-dependent dehydrogenase (short-subunit alcohol dehydrogenase family)
MLLQSRIAVVTGGARGIGRAIALRLGGEGATVSVCDLDLEGANSVAEEIRRPGGSSSAYRLDAADEPAVKAFFRALRMEHGGLDILVNNAGLCRNVLIEDIDGQEWDRYLQVNLKSVFLCSKEALLLMKERRSGKIISLASAAAKIGGVVAGAHYAAAKAGVICFTKSLALQAAPYGINVNAIAPGPIATAMTDAWGPELKEAFVEKIPLHRYGTPEEVAEVALLLASDRAAFITGEVIDINGGLVMD